jgi:hypothetical protein
MFCPFSWEGSLNWALALETKHVSTGTLLVNMMGGSFTGDFEGKVNYQGMCKRKLWRWVSLSAGAH